MASGYFPTFSYTEYIDDLSGYTNDVFSQGVTCGCTGKTYGKRNSFATHIKSQKHIRWVKSLNDEIYKQNNIRDSNNNMRDSNNTCIICTEILNKSALSLPCAHTFCTACIGKWLKIKPECPICKCSV